VLQHTGLFRGVLFYNRRKPSELWRLVRRLRQAHDALVYYLSPPRSAARLRRDRWFFRHVCAVPRIAAMPAPRPVVLRDEQRRLRVLPRESERLLHSVDPHGARPDLPFLQPTAAATQRVHELLSGLADGPLIALGPGSKMPAKRWFLPRFIEVCHRIVAQHERAALLVLGGAEDRELGLAIESALGADRVRNLAGQTDIIESAAALARCAMYVGNDTGTMHLAASMGVPCVAIFTSRDNRDTWSPWGDQHAVLRRDLGCSGCMLERCEREKMRCLELISVDDVWREVARRLPEVRLGQTVVQPEARGSR
jgi:ADP-heptose:LPS heptosyltransferase